MAGTLLIIDDDTRLSAMLADYLANSGYKVRTAINGRKGLEDLNRNPPDAVILDVMLPDIDGFEICRTIRSKSQVPILMLTAKGEETDRIVGLELGADDYLPKPFSPRELLARLKAILRRSNGSNQTNAAPGMLAFGTLEIDRDARTIRVDGNERPLTGHQFDLLLAMAENAGRVMTREKLMELVRGEDLDAFDRSIDVHVSRIRQAIEENPKHPRRILTIRGSGYVFSSSQSGE